MDYGLKEMNKMDSGLKKVRYNVTREELKLIYYVVV